MCSWRNRADVGGDTGITDFQDEVVLKAEGVVLGDYVNWSRGEFLLEGRKNNPVHVS